MSDFRTGRYYYISFMRTSLVAAVTALALIFPTSALSQETPEAPISPPPLTAENAENPETDQGEDEQPTSRETAPNTDGCPFKQSPPQARTTSEAVAPGTPSPTALPIPDIPAGGPLMADCGVITPGGFALPADQTASAWMVFDLDSGEIIATKDPHGRYRPASTIKALLALVAIAELDPAKKVTGTWDAANIVGSRVGVGEDGNYTIAELLHGLLLASGNDAAHLLAQELGGDETTLQKINELALKIGTQDTFAASYSGLDAPGMSTSAYDMALIYQYAWQDPTFARIVATEYIDFPGWGDNEGFQVWNDNGLFLNDPDGIGGKTGFTDDANHTFVGALDRGGRRLAAVLLDTTTDKARPWEQARMLIDASLPVLPGAGVGQLGELSEPAEETDSTTIVELPEAETVAPDEGSDSEGSSMIDIAKVALPIGVIVLLLIAALAWTFRKRG